MGLIELAGEAAGTAEAAEVLSGRALDDLDHAVVLVDDEHQPLIGVGREIDGDRRTAALLELAVLGRRDRLPGNVDGALQRAHLVVEADRGAEPVADIEHPVIGHGQAMHGLHVVDDPLAQELAGLVQHRHAAVAVRAFAVGDVDVAVLAVHIDAGRHVERRGRRIQRLALVCAVGGIELALLPDLKKQLAAVMGVFLNHARGRAGDLFRHDRRPARGFGGRALGEGRSRGGRACRLRGPVHDARDGLRRVA